MKVVTALRADRPGRVAVDLDGKHWRTLPLDAVVHARLAEGKGLDRELARELGRELRRLRALGTAVGALRVRDRSTAELSARLEARGIAPVDRGRTLEILARAGLVDDRRFACSRAASLAVRSNGNGFIRNDLEQRAVPAAEIETAIAALEPESERAARVVERRGSSPRTARYLAARGFADDVVEGAVAWEDAEGVG